MRRDVIQVFLGFGLALSGALVLALMPPPWFLCGAPLIVTGLIVVDAVVMRP